jgi:hypothetical protein
MDANSNFTSQANNSSYGSDGLGVLLKAAAFVDNGGGTSKSEGRRSRPRCRVACETCRKGRKRCVWPRDEDTDDTRCENCRSSNSDCTRSRQGMAKNPIVEVWDPQGQGSHSKSLSQLARFVY